MHSTKDGVVAAVLALVVPAAGLLLYVNMFGVNVVYGDEWDFVPFLERAMDGTLSYGDLLAQHNEHRLLFPRIVMIALGKLTHFNSVAEMVFGWFMILAASTLIFRVSWMRFSSGGLGKFALIFLPASLLLFTYRQFEAILFGFPSVQFYLMIFGVVSSLCLLEWEKRNQIGFTLSTLAAFVASFSSLQGLFVWPAGLFQILLSGRKRRSLIWGFVGVLIIVAYLHGWVKPSQTPFLDYTFSDPLAASGFFFALLGAPFSYEFYTALAFGVIVFLTGVIVFWRNHSVSFLRRNRLWLSITCFSVLTCIALTVGRSGFGLMEGLASRYTPTTIIGIVGLYFLSADASRDFRNKRTRPTVTRVLLITILLGSIISYGGGIVAAQFVKCRFETSAYILETIQSQPDERIRFWLYPWDTPSIRERAAFLEEYRLNVFSQPAVTVPGTNSTQCQTLFRLFDSYREYASGKLPTTVLVARVVGSPVVGFPIILTTVAAVALAATIILASGKIAEKPYGEK